MQRTHVALDGGAERRETEAFEALVARIAARLEGSGALASWIIDDSDRRAMIVSIIEDVGDFVLRWVEDDAQETTHRGAPERRRVS